MTSEPVRDLSMLGCKWRFSGILLLTYKRTLRGNIPKNHPFRLNLKRS